MAADAKKPKRVSVLRLSDSYEQSHEFGCGRIRTEEELCKRIDQILAVLEKSLPATWNVIDLGDELSHGRYRQPAARAATRYQQAVGSSWIIKPVEPVPHDGGFQVLRDSLKRLGWFVEAERNLYAERGDASVVAYAQSEDGFDVTVYCFGPSSRYPEICVASPPECPIFPEYSRTSGLLQDIREILNPPYRERMADPGASPELRASLERAYASASSWRYKAAELSQLPALEWRYRKHRFAAWLFHLRADFSTRHA